MKTEKKAKKFRFKPNKRLNGKENLSNGERADCAKAALVAFHQECSEAADENGPDEDGVKDLFADLLHYCDREGLDGLALFETAKNVYWQEER